MRPTLVFLTCAAILFSCSGDDQSDTKAAVKRYPDVIEVEVTETSLNVYSFDVTISSPYDSPERYADAWRVKGEDGTVFGVRELLHDHASEQPFTRSLNDVVIPAGIARVIIEGRDLEHGWGGETKTVELP